MTNLTRMLLGVMIATYLGFFLVEALLWTLPWVHDLLLPQLNPGLPYPAGVQVEILEALFRNQGVYNLLLGLGGVYGLHLWKLGSLEAGVALLTFLCLFAVGAGLTLLATTDAYLLGAAQVAIPLAALPSMQRDIRRLRARAAAAR